MNINELTERVEKYDKDLAKDIAEYVRGRQYGLVYEASKPEFVRLWNKPIVKGDLVNVLPPRGVMEDTKDDSPSNIAYCFLGKNNSVARIRNLKTQEEIETPDDSLVAIARFDQPIYCGLKEVDRVERGGDSPYHVVINGENYHALQTLGYAYSGKVDCIYIDPPYNTGAKDWKYNNNYVGEDDAYRHSKWLTFMEDRLRIAKKLLNPKESVLIVTIDEREYLRLGLLLEQMFPEARIQMISSVISFNGSVRKYQCTRVDEYIFMVEIGDAYVHRLNLNDDWRMNPSDNRSLHLRWASLIRTGSGPTKRPMSDTLFYPIFISDDGKRIIEIGEPLPNDVDRHTINKRGCVAVWPIHQDGTEGCWNCKKQTLEGLVKSGYVKLGRFNGERTAVSYLTKGAIKKIVDGVFSIEGFAEDGSIVSTNENRSILPPTQWKVKTHDATVFGSNLLKDVLIDRKFPFPKSVYAVKDVIKFFVSDKKNALIVDFFAGSGTTLHAVNLLNAEDDGTRKCICVTNNELTAEEQEQFVKKNLRQGDEEWEKYGIARYVTWPRTVCSIKGIDINGKPLEGKYIESDQPMSKGFLANAVFFELTYEEPSVVSADCAFEKIAPIIWLRAGCSGSILQHEDGYSIGKTYAILFDYSKVLRFIETLHNQPEIKHIFIVTDTKSRYRNMCMEFPNRDVIQLYESYLRSFEINAEE